MTEWQWNIGDADFRRFIEQQYREQGDSAQKARDAVIQEWLEHGDAKAFIEADAEGHVCGPQIQNLLATMLHDRRMKLSHEKKGGQPKPGTYWRNVLVTSRYKQQRQQCANSNDAFANTAKELGMNEKSVRDCVKYCRAAPKMLEELRSRLLQRQKAPFK